jgi:hypothetical protein
MAETMSNDGAETIRVTLDPHLREQFEDWRRRQSRIPTVSEGVRRLMSASLAADRQATA